MAEYREVARPGRSTWCGRVDGKVRTGENKGTGGCFRDNFIEVSYEGGNGSRIEI